MARWLPTAARSVRPRPARVLLALLAVLVVVPDIPVGADPLDPGADRRLAGPGPVAAAIEVSRVRRPAAGSTRLVVVARDDVFADALAASPLLGDGVLLLTPGDRLAPDVGDEVDRVLAPTGEVVVAGGPAAVAEAVLDDLRERGHLVRRVAGDDRVATALALADEAVARGASADTVVMARAFGDGGAAWADSVAVGPHVAAREVPLLLTRTDTVPAGVRTWLDEAGTAVTTVVGGPAAVAPSVLDALPGARRVAGADREATAVAIARELVGVAEAGPRALGVFDARAPDGWAWGLVAGSRLADLPRGALLAVRGDGDTVPDAAGPAALTGPAGALLTSCEEPAVRLLVSASTASLSPALGDRLARLDGACPGADGTSPEGWTVSGVHVGPLGSGPTRTFTVEVEPEVGVPVAELREVAVEALLDQRSWTRAFRLQQVGPGEPADLRVVLARPATVDRYCGRVGLRTAGVFSCWDGARAMLNADRYRSGAAPFDGDLVTYRRYLVNHEVGHGLGQRHVGCPRRGVLAPVMMQQTKGLAGCVANGWPFPAG